MRGEARAVATINGTFYKINVKYKPRAYAARIAQRLDSVVAAATCQPDPSYSLPIVYRRAGRPCLSFTGILRLQERHFIYNTVYTVCD